MCEKSSNYSAGKYGTSEILDMYKKVLTEFLGPEGKKLVSSSLITYSKGWVTIVLAKRNPNGQYDIAGGRVNKLRISDIPSLVEYMQHMIDERGPAHEPKN